MQEVILGIGGVRMLEALGYTNIQRYHMNEGHASLLTLELLDEHLKETGKDAMDEKDIEAVRRKCVFTTHTPVPAGHDKFPIEMVHSVIGHHPAFDYGDVLCCDGIVNLTHVAMNLSHFVNGVAKRHMEVSREMFHSYTIDSITNGVHAETWTSPAFQELFDRYIPGWKSDNFSLRYALDIPKTEIHKAHAACKKQLFDYVRDQTGVEMDVGALTLGFARRAAAYKRAYLLFYDIERLKRINADVGRIQVIYAGKAHPQDQGGKELIRAIFEVKESLKDTVKVVYLEDYDVGLAKRLTSGVDIWLNTPEPPMEASGTSGMKAALNGIPSLSILDGWWLEGCIEGVTGWAIGDDVRKNGRDGDGRTKDATSLYDKLERVIIPLYYDKRDAFGDIMLHAIALNGSFFNTQRMLQEYVLKAYVRWSETQYK
jgi:starch phosphorylase